MVRFAVVRLPVAAGLVAVALSGCLTNSDPSSGDDEHCCGGTMWRLEREPPEGYFDIDWARVPGEAQDPTLETLFDLALNHTPLTSNDPQARDWDASTIAGGLHRAYEAQDREGIDGNLTGTPPPGSYGHDQYDTSWRILYEGKGLAFEWSEYSG